MSDWHSFRTNLGPDSEPTLAIFADLGLVDAKSVPLLTREAMNGTIDAAMHVGDLAYDLHDDEGRKADAFMNMMQAVTARVPFQVVPGNHEERSNFSHFDHLFSMIDEGSKQRNNFYYSLNMGPMHVVSITNEFYFFYKKYGTQQILSQYNWLIHDLTQANRIADSDHGSCC